MAVAGLSAALSSSSGGVRNKARRSRSAGNASQRPVTYARIDDDDIDVGDGARDADADIDADDEEQQELEELDPADAASIGSAALGDWDFEEKETWRITARDWYAKGLAEVPGTGRLHHHLGILSRAIELRALYHFCKR